MSSPYDTIQDLINENAHLKALVEKLNVDNKELTNAINKLVKENIQLKDEVLEFYQDCEEI